MFYCFYCKQNNHGHILSQELINIYRILIRNSVATPLQLLTLRKESIARSMAALSLSLSFAESASSGGSCFAQCQGVAKELRKGCETVAGTSIKSISNNDNIYIYRYIYRLCIFSYIYIYIISLYIYLFMYTFIYSFILELGGSGYVTNRHMKALAEEIRMCSRKGVCKGIRKDIRKGPSRRPDLRRVESCRSADGVVTICFTEVFANCFAKALANDLMEGASFECNRDLHV